MATALVAAGAMVASEAAAAARSPAAGGVPPLPASPRVAGRARHLLGPRRNNTAAAKSGMGTWHAGRVRKATATYFLFMAPARP